MPSKQPKKQNQKNSTIETGILLVKIAAIINFVIAGLLFFFGLIAFVGLSIYRTTPFNLGFFVLFIAIILLLFGFLFWKVHERMSDTKTAKNGAIWSIVLGALLISNISGILALIGGILVLVELDKSNKK